MLWKRNHIATEDLTTEGPSLVHGPEVTIPLAKERPSLPRPFLFSKETWVFIILTILSLLILFQDVDLVPHVDNDFFFSSEDPHYQADTLISKLFVRRDNQLIISVQGNILSETYYRKIENLCDLLSLSGGVTGVKSIARGPRSVHDALHGEFWRRLLIPKNKKSSNVVVIIEDKLPDKEKESLIDKIEDIANAFQSEDFRIQISGAPYIAELIRRSLHVDLKTFSTLAFILFGIMIVLVFHSWRIFSGMIICCLNAGAVTLMLSHLFNIKIGLLTANLITIVFVLTLSHIIFLTFNWKNIHQASASQSSSVQEAVRITCWASFWCMSTTLLGFLSLLFVPAKPLRELGISGSLGTAVAFLIVYSIYPAFLRLKETSHLTSDDHVRYFYERIAHYLHKGHALIVILLMGIIIFTIPKLWELNTDPSLFSYFAERSDIREGLESIDRNGGSNPLVMVVTSKSDETFNTKRAYRRLWALQKDLDKFDSAGTIISLPTLMAEGKRSPLSFFIVWEWYLRMLERPQYDRIAESFVTPDRRYGLFLLRMKETDRPKPRLDIIEDLKKIVERHNFIPYLMGGIYALQGHLSRLVADSLIYSIGQLILVFAVIAFIFGRSLRISLAMTLSLTTIPLCILGIVGYFKIPLDTVSAPAANVALGIGIDSMIHMVNIYHRSRSQGITNGERWRYVTQRMTQPILTSMFVIAVGFGIFFFSSFPPTQRFGGSIVLGAVVAAFTALFIFPLLAKQKA